MDDVAACLAELRENREIHVQWRDHLKAHAAGEPCAQCAAQQSADIRDVVGDEATHDVHIAKYDRAIRIIERLR